MLASGTLSNTLLQVLHAALQGYSKSTDTRSGVQMTLLALQFLELHKDPHGSGCLKLGILLTL